MGYSARRATLYFQIAYTRKAERRAYKIYGAWCN